MQKVLQLIQKTIAAGLPMVIYSKPGDRIKAMVQQDAQTRYVKDFTEQGFVFAPFDDRNKALIIPYNKSTQTFFEEQPMAGVDKVDNKNAIVPLDTQKASHIALVEKGIATIKEEVLKKVVLSRKQEVSVRHDAPEILFLKLLDRYPDAMVYLWFHPETGIWLGATPETLLQTDARSFSTMALAGTQAYKGTLEVDWGAKEIEEQQLVTDEILKRLQEVSTLVQADTVHTCRAGNLLHLKTDIHGVFEGIQGLEGVIKALHPTPAVCGLPKNKAKTFILNNEGYDRAYYTGFLGELNDTITIKRSTRKRNTENQAYAAVKKQTHLFVNLRCMQYRDGVATLYIGGGITKGSQPESEWEETVRKAETIWNIL